VTALRQPGAQAARKCAAWFSQAWPRRQEGGAWAAVGDQARELQGMRRVRGDG
jgi:hypothetical protein